MVTENLTIPDQIIGNIPNAGMITTTGSIAVVQRLLHFLQNLL